MYKHIGVNLKFFEDMRDRAGFEFEWDYATGPDNKARIGLEGWGPFDQSQEREWTKDGYLFPPQSQIKQFLRHAYRQAQTNRLNLAILLPSRVISAKYFKPYWDGHVQNSSIVDIQPIFKPIDMLILDNAVVNKRLSGTWLTVYLRYGQRNSGI